MKALEPDELEELSHACIGGPPEFMPDNYDWSTIERLIVRGLIAEIPLEDGGFRYDATGAGHRAHRVHAAYLATGTVQVEK
jgi:hypothetical protein